MNSEQQNINQPHHNPQLSAVRSFTNSSLHLSRLSQISFQQHMRPPGHNPNSSSNVSFRPQEQQLNVSFQHLSEISQQSNEQSFSISYRNFSVENSISQENQLQITVYERQKILEKVQHCIYLFKALQFLFFTLTTCSLTLYTLLWTQSNTINFYILITLFENGYHSLFLTSELIPMVSLFHFDLLHNYPNVLITSYVRNLPTQIKFKNTMAFFLQRKAQQVVINAYLYIGVFIIGCLDVANPQIPMWFKCLQLSLGLFVVILFLVALAIGCLMLPFIICYLLVRQNVRENQENEIIEEQSQRFDLPSTQKVQDSILNQPCYICLQEYEKGDLIIKLRCHGQHIFHKDCIEPWALSHNHCPVCRQVLQ